MNKSFFNLPVQNTWSTKPYATKFMHGWFGFANKAILNAAFLSKPKNILELGAWYGKSTKYLLDNCPDANVFSVDIWDDKLSWIQKDSTLNAIVKEHPVFETFLANFWDYRNRLCPIKMSSLEAIPLLSQHGIEVDCVYLDSGHYYEETKKEVRAVKKHFPKAFLCGDDYYRDDCRKGLNEISEELGMSLLIIHNAWILLDDMNKHDFKTFTNYDYSRFYHP